jgi:hypothetical protein
LLELIPEDNHNPNLDFNNAIMVFGNRSRVQRFKGLGLRFGIRSVVLHRKHAISIQIEDSKQRDHANRRLKRAVQEHAVVNRVL